MAALAVVEPAAPPPDAGARPVFAKAMRECGPVMRGGAYVVPAGGFAAATIRAAITGLSLLAREPYPIEVFAAPERASAWIAERLGDGWTGARVLAAVVRARQG